MRVLVVAVAAAVLCLQCECQSSQRSAVGEGCATDGDCVPAANCTNRLCTCPTGYSHLADLSRCVVLSQQNVMEVPCISNDNCTKMEGTSRCLVPTANISRCICDTGYQYHLNLSKSSCMLPCTKHTSCAKENPAHVCKIMMDSEGSSNSTFCGMRVCESETNCTDIPNATCVSVGSNTKLRSCQLQRNNTFKAGDGDSKMEKTFSTFLLIAVCAAGGSLLLMILCVAFIMAGVCSGDPQNKTVRGRGLPMIRQRLPPQFLGGPRYAVPAAPVMPVPMARSASVGSVVLAPRASRSSVARPSVSSIHESISMMDLPSQTSSYAPSSVATSSFAPSSVAESSFVSSVDPRGQYVVVR